MDGKLFLGTARFLRSNGSDEAAYRSAVSRAYYACFLDLRQIAFDHCDADARLKAGIRNVRRIGHGPLQRYLKNSPRREVRRLGEDLASLHGNRLDADYNMEQTLTAHDSQDAIDDAQSLLDASSSVDPAKIGNAMAEHIRQTHA